MTGAALSSNSDIAASISEDFAEAEELGMAQDAIRSERLLIVARVTQRQMATFPGRGWVAVEVFQDETVARERFHQLRIPLERLKLGAVLIRALTSTAFDKIAFEKTVISKDADFWELQHADIQRATSPQQEEWNAAIGGILRDLAGEREEAKVASEAHRVARLKAESGSRRMLAAAGAGFAVVLAAAGVLVLGRSVEPPMDRAVARAREGTMTVIIADAADPRVLTEYALKPDGTRTAVRRLTREQVAAGVAEDEPATTATSAKGPAHKNLVDALSGFFAFRE
jgi:hypothetical protein